MKTRNRKTATHPRPRTGIGGFSTVLLLTTASRDPLANDVRKRIHEYVHENPGAHLRAIARALALDTNQAKYHLVQLEQYGLVTVHRIYGHCAFFPGSGSGRGLEEDAVQKAHLFLLRKKVPARVAAKLLMVGEATHTDLQKAVGVSASTLYYHLRRLEEQEVLSSRKIRRNQYWRLGSPSLCERILEEEAVQALLVKEANPEDPASDDTKEPGPEARQFYFSFLGRRR